MAVRVTVHPSRYRVVLTVYPDRIEPMVLDIPDGDFSGAELRCLQIEPVFDDPEGA